MTVPVRERGHQAADFGRERMMPTIARCVQPPDLTRGAGRRQRVQHRQYRRCPDSRTEQHQRPFPGLQNKAAARRTDVERVAHHDVLSQVSSRRPLRLDFHTDSIALRRDGA